MRAFTVRSHATIQIVRMSDVATDLEGGSNMMIKKAIAGAMVGALIALAATLGIAAMFTSFATDTNATIREQFKTNPSLLKESAALEELHRRIAEEGGLRGFLAGRVLANGGLGYPQAHMPAARVWIYAAVAGAAIGAVAPALRGWALPLVLAAVVWGLIAPTSPVASTTILWAGAVGGAAVLAVVEVTNPWSEPR
jgi:hypothetical protein